MSDTKESRAAGAAFGPFLPPVRRLLGPGPSDVHPRVLAAMARPTIGHLDPAFVAMMEQVKELLRYAFQTENDVTFPISGPGSVGMETCFVNLVEPGDTVVVCRNGVFGGRMIENVRRCGGTAVVVDDELGRAGLGGQARGRLARAPRGVGGRLRAGRDLDGRAHRAGAAGRPGPQPRLSRHRRRRDGAGRLSGQDRRVADRRHLQRQPEMPVVPARPGAGELWRPRRGEGPGAHHRVPELVHGPRAAAGLLVGRSAHLPPHGPDQRPLRPARSAAHAARRGARARLAAPSPQSRGAGRRPARHGGRAVRRRARLPAAAQHGRSSPRASTTPPPAAGCSSSSASRWAAAWARWPARCGASGSWATRAAKTTCSPSWRPSSRSSPRRGARSPPAKARRPLAGRTPRPPGRARRAAAEARRCGPPTRRRRSRIPFSPSTFAGDARLVAFDERTPSMDVTL